MAKEDTLVFSSRVGRCSRCGDEVQLLKGEKYNKNTYLCGICDEAYVAPECGICHKPIDTPSEAVVLQKGVAHKVCDQVWASKCCNKYVGDGEPNIDTFDLICPTCAHPVYDFTLGTWNIKVVGKRSELG